MRVHWVSTAHHVIGGKVASPYLVVKELVVKQVQADMALANVSNRLENHNVLPYNINKSCEIQDLKDVIILHS